MSNDAIPCAAAVARDKDSAAGAAGVASPGLDVNLPGPGEEDAGIVGIHGEFGGAGVLINEQNALPVLASIGCAINSAFLLRAIAGAECGDKDDVRIFWINDHA